MFLYVKTHNKTGLKYLGKTTAKNPHAYKGSGKRWKRHIKKHSYDVTTHILLETNNEHELKETGLFFSKLWNIVESNEWANCKPEEGDGIGSEFSSKINKERIQNGTHNFFDKDLIKKRNTALKKTRYKQLEEGTHHFQSAKHKEKVSKTQTELIKNNKHNLQGGDVQREMWKNENHRKKITHLIAENSRKRVSNGTHNLLGENNPVHKQIENGTFHLSNNVLCYDKNGNRVRVSKEEYHSQSGPKEDWNFVHIRSKEANLRKRL